MIWVRRQFTITEYLNGQRPDNHRFIIHFPWILKTIFLNLWVSRSGVAYRVRAPIVRRYLFGSKLPIIEHWYIILFFSCQENNFWVNHKNEFLICTVLDFEWSKVVKVVAYRVYLLTYVWKTCCFRMKTATFQRNILTFLARYYV